MHSEPTFNATLIFAISINETDLTVLLSRGLLMKSDFYASVRYVI